MNLFNCNLDPNLVVKFVLGDDSAIPTTIFTIGPLSKSHMKKHFFKETRISSLQLGKVPFFLD